MGGSGYLLVRMGMICPLVRMGGSGYPPGEDGNGMLSLPSW